MQVSVCPCQHLFLAVGPRWSIKVCDGKDWRRKRHATHNKVLHSGGIPVLNVRVECCSRLKRTLQGKGQFINVSLSTLSLLLGRAEVSRSAVGRVGGVRGKPRTSIFVTPLDTSQFWMFELNAVANLKIPWKTRVS